MPREVTLLQHAPVPFGRCPVCTAVFRPFLRGQVQRGGIVRYLLPSWWLCLLIGQPWPYCALICSECKEVIGWEAAGERS